jgi:hypothetical protein
MLLPKGAQQKRPPLSIAKLSEKDTMRPQDESVSTNSGSVSEGTGSGWIRAV